MEYVLGDALVETEWLADNLDAPGVKICDATFYLPSDERVAAEQYAAQHIPGAVYFNVDDICDPDSPLPHMLPSNDIFSEKIGALGVGNDDNVIVYDANGGGMAAARAWWTFRVFGHSNVALLNGGLPKWLAEGRAVSSEIPSPEAQPFKAEKNSALVRSLDQMLANVDSAAEQVADARGRGRFEGTAPEPREGMRSGHIPGSRNLPYDQFMDAERNFVMRSPEDLAAAITAAGVDMEKPLITSCGSGVTASLLAFGFYLMGKEDVAVYDGSWTEWGARDDTPIET
ncbi:MAG: sulfurtransferase [Proteobacteria bacterium]|nr:sulfurtransferase [Pseudomonadota bacterium]MDA1023158.1 sulfurtransferase [Pseudomonadota bacterium]